MAAALVASTVISPQPLTNVAVYYGQGANQQRLSHFCGETSLDIINLAFLNVFPDQGNGYPGTNFGNQCGSATYSINGNVTQFLSDCPQLAEDIPVCQTAGKKVFVSLGGAYPATQEITSDQSALDFANFIWGAFGPVTDEWTQADGPRPFGDAVVDGFDFDIEHNGSFVIGALSGYAMMINQLKTLYATVPDRQFYLSAAPQCPIPDPQLKVTINKGMFDYIWVQYYNTASCAAINYAQNATGFNYDEWVDVILASSNPDARLFIGLPASEDSAYSGYYLTPDQVEPLVNEYMTLYPGTFGGIMLWEATSSDNNTINNMTYADSMKAILNEAAEPWTSPPTTGNSSSNVGWGQINKSSLAWASFNSSRAVCPGKPALEDSSIESACAALVANG
ncbi:hypothetical protein N7474_008129 [Penicillium riverlandense]|uniref:uncharacterized protein n=1 Tax=Penicillium riverlandense TaxID=1903569 RepID=UPI00254945E6|nr:uncharacterized protein N7474_008129 [Penicillium riverlandense]KAJ5811828.1 hypothetical protein N7474_008129 [Penicillium riverlandense]